MAVPKRKTAKSKTKMRSAANSKMTATGFVGVLTRTEPMMYEEPKTVSTPTPTPNPDSTKTDVTQEMPIRALRRRDRKSVV